MQWQIKNGWIPGYQKRPISINIDGQRISQIGTDVDAASTIVDLHGLAILPAFINSHDNLLATYFPFQGRNWPYKTWLGWDNEIKVSPLFAERMLINTEDLYLLGAYRNIFSGSVFVVDHIPDFVRKPFEEILPVSILKNFGISHSVSSYSLNWGKGISQEHEFAVKNNLPYIVHIAEGFDRDSKQSLQQLYQLGALTEHTVLVHGLSLSENDLDLVAKAGAHIVWCPPSNRYIYNAQPPIGRAINRGINVCLGTDSAMSGGFGMIQSIKAAHNEISSLDPLDLLSMASVNASLAFREKGRGSLDLGQFADLLILNQRRTDNVTELIENLKNEDIFLLVREGLPVYGDIVFEQLFHSLSVEFNTILVGRTEKLVIKGWAELMQRIETQIGKSVSFPFIPAI